MIMLGIEEPLNQSFICHGFAFLDLEVRRAHSFFS